MAAADEGLKIIWLDFGYDRHHVRLFDSQVLPILVREVPLYGFVWEDIGVQSMHAQLFLLS